MTVYKIRNKETGLFSKGGTYTGNYLWTKNGKPWSNIAHVKNHLNYFNRNRADYPYHNAEIIELEINYDENYSYPVSVLMDEIQSKREDEEKLPLRSLHDFLLEIDSEWNRFRTGSLLSFIIMLLMLLLFIRGYLTQTLRHGLPSERFFAFLFAA